MRKTLKIKMGFFTNGHLMYLHNSHWFNLRVPNIINIYMKLYTTMIGISTCQLFTNVDIIEILLLCKHLTNHCRAWIMKLKKLRIMLYLNILFNNTRKILDKHRNRPSNIKDKLLFDLILVLI
jgi:hypothetical protein